MVAASRKSDRNIVVLGPRLGSRLESFVAACVERFGQPPQVIGWNDFLRDPSAIAAVLHPGSYLKFESPDRDIEALAALYEEGAALARAAEIPTLAASEIEQLGRGAIGSPAQLWFGLVSALDKAAAIAAERGAAISFAPELARLAFDKSACQAHFRTNDLPTPQALAAPTCFDELDALMREASAPRVFVKLRHGAAAAGMIALARSGDRWQAWTTARIGEGNVLYSARDVELIVHRHSIARLVDRLAPLMLHVERWVPKLGLNGETVDLRIIVANGKTVSLVRGSRQPMTNLHIGGSRHTPARLVSRIGVEAWRGVLETAHRAAASLPRGDLKCFDIAVLACGRRHALLEANAFGDYIKGLAVDPHRVHAALIARERAQPDVAA